MGAECFLIFPLEQEMIFRFSGIGTVQLELIILAPSYKPESILVLKKNVFNSSPEATSDLTNLWEICLLAQNGWFSRIR